MLPLNDLKERLDKGLVVSIENPDDPDCDDITEEVKYMVDSMLLVGQLLERNGLLKHEPV